MATTLFSRFGHAPSNPSGPIGCSDSQNTEKGLKIDTEPNQHRIPVHVVSLTGAQPLLICKISNGNKNVLKRSFFIYTTRHLFIGQLILLGQFAKFRLY